MVEPQVFDSTGKEEIFLAMERIGSWDDGGYALSMSYYRLGQIEGGHEATVWGSADEYWRDGEEIKDAGLRMHVKISSDLSRHDMEQGILGGGTFHKEHVQVDLNLDPGQVRDIVNELRLSAFGKLYISGHAIGPTVFRVTRFGMSEPRGDEAPLFT